MTFDSLKAKTVKELKSICRDMGLKGYSKLNEDDIINMILDSKGEEPVNVEKVVLTPTTVRFKKIIKGPFGFKGKVYHGGFELSDDEAKDPRIERALETGVIQIAK